MWRLDKMKVVLIVVVTIFFIICAFLGIAQKKALGQGNRTLELKVTHENYRIVTPIIETFGNPVKAETLLQAFKDKEKWKAKDISILRNAAAILGQFPRSDDIIQTLTDVASNDDDDILATRAMIGLHGQKEESWVEIAIKRLPRVKHPVDKIQLAGLMAKDGHADGWSVVLAGVLDDQFGSVALEHVDDFDGLPNKAGDPINVNDELNSLIPLASTTGKARIKEKIERRIKEQTERQARKEP
jgi:hypothetical protein